MPRSRWSALAVAGAALALVMLGVYLRIVRGQDEQPAWWAVAMLVVGACAAGYGALRTNPAAQASLLLAALLLGSLGVVAILSIGLPILLAGGLCLLAFLRRAPAPPGEDPT